MTQLISKIDLKSSKFKNNNDLMQQHVHQYEKALKLVQKGGTEKAHQRLHQQGKLFVRERIRRLIDNDTKFLEFSALAGYELYEENIASAGIITGIGYIHQTLCVIIANDATVKGGAYYPITVKKHLRAQEIAEQNFLPCVYLVDSGGAFLPLQHEVFPDRDHFGRIFYNQARMSAKNIPQIAVVMGSCTAGGAYVPAMADQVVMVREQATIFLAGPPLVKVAIGETVSSEQLGGADLHCRKSGVADYLVEDDDHALQQTREIIANIPSHTASIAKIASRHNSFSTTELNGIVSADPRHPYDVREVIMRIIDAAEFSEFKQYYGQSLVCGFAHIDGFAVGIIANNGILFSDSALKGAHFIELCSQRRIPLLFLQNINGFMVGKHAEMHGIAKHGAKMVHVLACSAVPKITIIIGNSYGAGNYAMCGRSYNPHFLFMWPNAKIGVMGGNQAASVLADIKRNSLNRNGKHWSLEDEESFKIQMQQKYEKQSQAIYSTARLWDDGIILPHQTRGIAAICLKIVYQNPTKDTQVGVLRM